MNNVLRSVTNKFIRKIKSLGVILCGVFVDDTKDCSRILYHQHLHHPSPHPPLHNKSIFLMLFFKIKLRYLETQQHILILIKVHINYWINNKSKNHISTIICVCVCMCNSVGVLDYLCLCCLASRLISPPSTSSSS